MTSTEEQKRIARQREVRKADLAISHKVVRTLLAAGFAITVDNGGSEDGDYEIVNSTNFRSIFAALQQTDEDYVMAMKERKRFGWVRLIYGESGWDVICDYSTNLEPWIGEGSPVAATQEYWEKRISGGGQ